MPAPQVTRDVTNITPTRVTADQNAGAAYDGLAKGVLNLGEIYQKHADELDTLKATDALNKVRQARLDLTMGDAGGYSVKGGDVLSPTYVSGYKDRLNTTIQGLMPGLTAKQQAYLKTHAEHELLGLQTDLYRHSISESEKYATTVQAGDRATTISIGAASWADPVAFKAQADRLQESAETEAHRAGIVGRDDKEMATITAMTQKAMSPMYAAAITAALDAHNLGRATELFAQGKDALDPAIRIKVDEHLTKLRETTQVQTDAAKFTAEVVQPANTIEGRLAPALASADVLASGITKAESGNRPHYADGYGVLLGPVIQSGPSKGLRAVGKHQIMPASGEQDAKEAGIPWSRELFYSASKEGEAYHDKLQTAHIARLTKLFTTVPEIAAAYNAGEGNVQEAKAKFAVYQQALAAGEAPVTPGSYNANKDGPISFLDFLPKPGETKPYVARVVASVRASPDIVAPPVRDVEAAMAAKYPGRPDLAKEASALVKHQLDTAAAARKAEIATTEEQLYKYMGQGTSFNQLPFSLTSKLPPKELDAVRSTFDAHTSKIPRDSNQGLLAQINADPNYTARIPNEAWTGPLKTQLSEYDWDRFDKQRSARLGGNVKEAETLDEGSVHRVLSSRLRMLDIDPTPKESDTTGMGIVNSARAIVDQSILDRQRQTNKKLTDTEIIKHVDELFRNDIRLRSTFMGFGIGGADTLKVIAMKYADIPSDQLDAAKKQLTAAGIEKPTEVQLLTYYKQARMGMLPTNVKR